MNETIVALPNGDFWVDRRINPNRRRATVIQCSLPEKIVVEGKIDARSNKPRRTKQVNR